MLCSFASIPCWDCSCSWLGPVLRGSVRTAGTSMPPVATSEGLSRPLFWDRYSALLPYRVLTSCSVRILKGAFRDRFRGRTQQALSVPMPNVIGTVHPPSDLSPDWLVWTGRIHRVLHLVFPPWASAAKGPDPCRLAGSAENVGNASNSRLSGFLSSGGLIQTGDGQCLLQRQAWLVSIAFRLRVRLRQYRRGTLVLQGLAKAIGVGVAR